ncbi:9031_t:CDS:2, partial [Racocetra persica]
INLMANETDNIIFRKSRVKHPSLEKALSIWANQVIVSGLSVSEALISEKARYFAMIMGISEEDMKFSNSWLNGFKQRNNLKVKNHAALPVTYKDNEKAWMKYDIFEKWVKDLNYKFRVEDKRVLLLVDNAASYFKQHEKKKKDKTDSY